MKHEKSSNGLIEPIDFLRNNYVLTGHFHYRINSILRKVIPVDRKSSRKIHIDLDGDAINIYSLRLTTFLKKGTTCKYCGIAGRFFLKQKITERDKHFHINLYAINDDGKYVLMTMDHIIPKSKGGADHIDNMQTMCIVCNNNKGDIIDS